MSLMPLVKSVKKKIANKVFMLRKIYKYLNFAALCIYIQTNLPLIDYAGFLLLSCRSSDIDDLQKTQNDVLRICTMSKLSDKVFIVILNKKCKILGLKQRMQKQLLWLMYIMSHDDLCIRAPLRETRAAQKIVLKVPTRILPVYEHSPYYKGTIFWNELDEETQRIDNIFVFRKEIAKLYKCYQPL